MKKRIVLAACAWLLCLDYALADELTIGNVTVPQGGTAELTVGYRFTSTTDKGGFTFSTALPEGISFEKDTEGEVVYVKDATSISKLSIVCADEGNFAGTPASESATIKGTEGTLLTLTLRADATLPVGSTHTVGITKVSFQQRVEGRVEDIKLDDFTVTIGEPADTRTVLSELTTALPEAATGVDVRVKRTINANEWSTICLPFSMTAEQVTAAFGSGVRIGDFTGCDVDEETNGITANFASVTAIEKNHPYVIKVAEAVKEFTVDGVDIDPEEQPAVDMDEAGKGRNKTYNSFIGNYISGTEVPDYGLFLSEGQFWYSKGLTVMKAFRAYFDFATAGAEYDEARILLAFDETTAVGGITTMPDSDTYYNLSGQRVATPGKGIYIYNGKKVKK